MTIKENEAWKIARNSLVEYKYSKLKNILQALLYPGTKFLFFHGIILYCHINIKQFHPGTINQYRLI
jgi:hypothetical protein